MPVRVEFSEMALLQTRREGHMVCAYLLPKPDDFENGVQIGAIAGRALSSSRELMHEFMALMQKQVKVILRQAGAEGEFGEVFTRADLDTEYAKQTARDAAARAFNPENAADIFDKHFKEKADG